MADHKAPTQVSIAPYEEASQLQTMVTSYWKPLLGFAVVIAAVIIFRQRSEQQSTDHETGSWAQLGEQVELGNIGQDGELPESGVLALLTVQLDGSSAEPWARALEVEKLIEDQDWVAAESALTAFESDFAAHPLLKSQFPIGKDGTPTTVAAHLRAFISSERNFVASNPGLFTLPALPDGSPKVLLETTAGNITVGLFQGRAPLHVANFLKLVSSGYYDGVKFHRVVPGFIVQAGDPNSKVGDPSTWGLGGPDYKIEPELNGLFHFKGVLAGAISGQDVQSNGSQFYITAGNAHHLDKKHTVFGVVLDDDGAVRTIENSPTAPGTERPEEPAVLTKASIVE